MRKLIITFLAAGAALTAAAQGGWQDGVDYYNADRLPQAQIILEKTLNDANTNKGLANYYLGEIALREGDKAKAQSYFEAGKTADPACGYNYVGLGSLALLDGNKSVAEGYFKDALSFDKKDPAVNTAIARAYYNANPTEYSKQIDKYIADALKASKNKAPHVYALQGDMAASAGDVGQAAAYYEQAMIFAEEGGHVNPEAYVKYANLYNRTAPQFSIGKLQELKQKAPTSALAQRELAEKYYDAEQYGKAAAEYKEYMDNPNHFQQDEQRYSQLLYFGGNNAESLTLAKKVLQKDPGNAYMYRMVMLNDAALKNYEEAAQYGEKLFGQNKVALTSNDYNTYADVLDNLGRPDDALVIYEQGYNADPVKNRDMLGAMASTYYGMKQYDKAVEAQLKYINSGDTKLQELYNLTNYYQNLAADYEAGSPERVEAATEGLKYTDQALETAATPIPFLRNRVNFLRLRDGQDNYTPELADTYDRVLVLLDEDPDNRDSQYNLYRSAYATLYAYNYMAGNKEEAERYEALLKQITAEHGD